MLQGKSQQRLEDAHVVIVDREVISSVVFFRCAWLTQVLIGIVPLDQIEERHQVAAVDNVGRWNRESILLVELSDGGSPQAWPSFAMLFQQILTQSSNEEFARKIEFHEVGRQRFRWRQRWINVLVRQTNRHSAQIGFQMVERSLQLVWFSIGCQGAQLLVVPNIIAS